ncbi:MAG: asparagine synthase (glutamine-hydrolyzing) [Bacteroidota bacterium]
MCGIAGIVAPNSYRYSTIVKKMTDSIRHRGPDGEGFKQLDGCYLGHRRLSIVDIDGGEQPMPSCDNQSWIVFNGEIYGYQDIKKRLSNYPYCTQSDTEVILALYKKYGEKLSQYLPGMFSFAIWDNQQRQLIAARDRFGEKPFYYAWGNNGEFIFASEIKAILATGLVQTTINEEALAHYLQYLYVAPNTSIYNEIQALPPAHQLIYQDGNLHIRRFWDFPVTNPDITEDEAIQTFRTLLANSVEKQLVADVPVGAFLSGGLDSTTVAYEASKKNFQLNTYAFGFGDEINELPYAKTASKAYKTDHHELDARDYKLPDLMYKMAEVYDEPFADSSCIPTYLIAKEASKQEKVILSGDGADELLGGYDFWYHYLASVEKDFNTQWLQHLPKSIIHGFGQTTNLIGWKTLENKFKRFLFRSKFSHIVQVQRLVRQYFDKNELSELGVTSNRTIFNDLDVDDFDTLNDVLKNDMSSYMPGDILVKTDRASMANSLEIRAPFLDHELAEFCISLPSNFKFDESVTKKILRNAYKHEWPVSIRNRSKQGFGAPISNWLKAPDMQQLKNKIMLDHNNKLFDLIDFKKAQKYSNRNNYQTWTLLVLGIWLEK